MIWFEVAGLILVHASVMAGTYKVLTWWDEWQQNKKAAFYIENPSWWLIGDCNVCHQFPCKHTAELIGWNKKKR